MFRTPTKSSIPLPAVTLVALLFLTSNFVLLQPALAAFPGANVKIVFMHTSLVYFNTTLWTMNNDGSGQKKITDATGLTYPVWSPNGSKILCNVDWPTGGLFVMNGDGSNITQLVYSGLNDPRPYLRPAWSPDGSRLAFCVWSMMEHPPMPGIFIWNASTGPNGPWQQLTKTGIEPAWSLDGSKITFSSGNLYVMNADGSGQTQITFTGTGVENRGPAFSPDSRRIAFASDRTGNYEIYVMNANGSGVTQLTFSNSNNGEPAWSPDGSKIAFSSTRDGNQEIYVMDIDGSHVTRLTFNNLYDSRVPDWQPTPPPITVPPSSLARNSLGRVFFIFNNKKYYITNPAAFSSYSFNWAEVKTSPDPDSLQSSQINYDYLLDGKMPLPNKPYIAGDVNDGSLYYIPYFTWNGQKYPINGAGYNNYNGELEKLPIRYEDPALSLPNNSTILDGVSQIPSVTPPSFTVGKNSLGRVYLIFNNKKYYFTDWTAYTGYGFTNSNINSSVNPDSYSSARVSLDYILEDTTSVLRKPLPNQPYVAGDVNDGSLYWIPYWTWTGDKYPIKGTGFNGYNGQLKTLSIRFDDPAIDLPTSIFELNGILPIPTLLS